jgi:hypothetical protein
VKVFEPASIVAGAAAAEAVAEPSGNGSRVDTTTDLTLAAIND